VALAGCLATAPPPIEQPAAEPGTLSGRVRLEGVYSDQGPITLRLAGPSGVFVARTDSRGGFTFRDVPSGTYSLNATRDRYFPVTLDAVRVAPDATIPPITLRNHRVLVALAGHYDAGRLQEAEDPQFGGMVPTRSPFLTNLTLSPDGTRLGFLHGGTVASVRLDGTDRRTETLLPAGVQADWVDWGERGFLIRATTGNASASVMLLSGPEALTLVPAGEDEVFAPVFSPDEREVAYVRYEAHTKSPQLMRLGGEGEPPMPVLDLLDRLHLREIWTGTYGLMFSPIDWRPEGLMFHAPMTCSLERGDFTLGKDGIYVLRDLDAPEAPNALHKAHFYSYYAHAFSHDGRRMLYAYGPQIRSKDLADPLVTAPGVTVGHHSDELLEALTPSPDGDRLFYLTPSGIAEMNLLPLTP
jgi:hypothetical protein